jgi:hypothetical protein
LVWSVLFVTKRFFFEGHYLQLLWQFAKVQNEGKLNFTNFKNNWWMVFSLGGIKCFSGVRTM